MRIYTLFLIILLSGCKEHIPGLEKYDDKKEGVICYGIKGRNAVWQARSVTQKHLSGLFVVGAQFLCLGSSFERSKPSAIAVAASIQRPGTLTSSGFLNRSHETNVNNIAKNKTFIEHLFPLV